jgi:lysophospholipase L1-like esterase
VVAAVHGRQPKAGIVLVSLLPTNDEAKNREIVLPVNRHLDAMASRRPHADFVSYLDLYSDFVDASGRQRSELFNDGLHPTEAGYAIWRDRLVARLIAKRSDRKE